MSKSQLETPRSRLTLFAEAGTDAPVTLEFQLDELVQMAIWVTVVFLITSLGTLFFFRELELNRKLTDRVLELESTARLDLMAPRTPVVEDSKPTRSLATPEAAVSLGAPAAARIQEFTTQCKDVACEVTVDLIPAMAGTAQGEILFVLETELLRIGSQSETSAVRKKFLVEPGALSKDALSPDDVSQIAGKPFRFTRALKTQVSFNVGRSLHPIAINLYVFDSAKNLIQHERRVVEMEAAADGN